VRGQATEMRSARSSETVIARKSAMHAKGGPRDVLGGLRALASGLPAEWRGRFASAVPSRRVCLAVFLAAAAPGAAADRGSGGPVPVAVPRASGEAPALAPKLLALAVVGGPGDQWVQEVGFLSSGSVYGRGPGGSFTVLYSREGRYLGLSGNPAAPGAGTKGRNFAVNDKVRNPYDGTTWSYGYKQVAPQLQQPYLYSPFGWTWWDWTEAQAGNQRADTRCVGLWFQSKDRFVAQTWSDGGNTVQANDPRDVKVYHKLCGNGGRSKSFFLEGDAKTGEPLAGLAFSHRPQAACFDGWGRFYVSQALEQHPDCLDLGGSRHAGFCAADANLRPLASGTFVQDGQSLAMALQGGLLVVGGSVSAGGAAAALPKLVNPAQPGPGGGEDGFIALVKLW